MSDSRDQDNSLNVRSRLASNPGRKIFLVVGFLQGLALYALGESEWLEQNSVLGYPLRLLASVWPFLFLLTYRPAHVRRGVVWVSAFSVLLAMLASYIGWQATPHGKFVTNILENVFIATTVVAGFVALLHLQATIWRMDRKYDLVFTLSWRNFLTASLSSALTLGVWLVLYLWGRLFSAIDLEFFSDLFEENWFRFPVLATVFAFGLHSCSSATSVLDRIASLLQRLILILLPLTVLITTVFLISIAVTGLQPLVDTNRATSLLITFNVVSLFFLNAVYQTGANLPYASLAHRLISVGLALLPILAVLSLYAFLTRVSQYGWTLGRCWAVFVLALAALFSVAYTFLIAWRRDAWPSSLPGVNKLMSWVVLVALLITSSPLLDFRVISTRSQFARLETGEVALEDSILRYWTSSFSLPRLRGQLARPGYLRMQAFAESLDESDPEWASRLRILIGDEEQPPGWTDAQQKRIVLRPGRFEVPLGLAESISRQSRGVPDLMFRMDLGGDQAAEYICVYFESGGQRIHATCWEFSQGLWHRCGQAWVDSSYPEALLEELTTGEFEAITPNRAYKILRVGEQVIDFR